MCCFVCQAPYNTVTYFFTTTSAVDRFYIDSSSGQIFVRRTLVGEAATSFVVSLGVTPAVWLRPVH